MSVGNKAAKSAPSGEPNKTAGNMVSVSRKEPEPKKAETVVPAKVPPVSVQSGPSTVPPSKPTEPETIGNCCSVIRILFCQINSMMQTLVCLQVFAYYYFVCNF